MALFTDPSSLDSFCHDPWPLPCVRFTWNCDESKGKPGRRSCIRLLLGQQLQVPNSELITFPLSLRLHQPNPCHVCENRPGILDEQGAFLMGTMHTRQPLGMFECAVRLATGELPEELCGHPCFRFCAEVSSKGPGEPQSPWPDLSMRIAAASSSSGLLCFASLSSHFQV